MIDKTTPLGVLLEDIYTRQEADILINQLGELIDSLYRSNGAVSEKMDTYLSMSKKESLLAILEKSGVDINNTIHMQAQLNQFKKKISEVPTITLTFAYEPSAGTVKKICSWLSTNLDHRMLLDVEVDEEIMGGVMFTYKGLYRDFSVRKKFNDIASNGELQKMIQEAAKVSSS